MYRWLDLSGNNFDDEAVEMLLPLLPRLSGLHLKNMQSIGDKSLLLFRDYFAENATECATCWFIDLQNTSISNGEEWKSNQIEDGKDLFVTKKIEKVRDWNGIRKSSYGPHGFEYQLVQTLVGKSGTAYLSARKITGDPNVPYGKVTWYIEGIPKWIDEGTEVDEVEVVAGELQVRSDIRNVDGFSFENISIRAVEHDKLIRVWYNQCTLHRVSV